MSTGQSQIVIWLVIFAVGLIFGGLLAWVLAGRNSRRVSPPSPEQDAWLQLRSKYLERASLWQERGSSRLVVRVGNQMVANSNELSDAQRKNLNATLKDWLVWLGFPVTQAPAIEMPAPTPVVVAQPVEPVASLPPEPAGLVPGQGQAQPAQEKPKSIVGQIDEIVQEKLKDSNLVKKGVRLVEDPKQGVVVWVGLEHFSGVDAVTDPEVKAVLKAAVMEWERRQAPGKR